MKAQPRKSNKNVNKSLPLENFAKTIMEAEATPDAILDHLRKLGLGDQELIALVDFINEKAQPLMYGEHPVRLLELGKRAFIIADHINYDRGIANSLLYLGISQWFISDLSEALKNLAKAKNVFIDLDDDENEMKALMFEACVYRSMGDYDQSYLDLQRCIVFFRERKNTAWEALALLSLALTCGEIGDYKGMRRCDQRIIKIVIEPELQWMVGRALDGIGTIYFNSGQYRKAIESYEKALATCRKSHHPISEARVLNDLGMVYQRLGDAGKASNYYHESLKIRKDMDQREAQCTCLFNLGSLSMEANEPEKALAYFNQALSIATDKGAKPRVSQAHKHLSSAYEKIGDSVNALQHYKRFQQINEEVTSQQSDTRIKTLITRLELDKAEKVAEVEKLKNTKLNEKNEELERLLNELQEAQAQLVQSEKMAALGKLVAGVTHEMNSPIGASSSSIDISKRCINKIQELVTSCNTLEELKSDDDLEKLLDNLLANNRIVSDANERISKIVRSLKSFSNLDEAAFQKTDIHAGLDSTITLLETELNDRIKIIKQYGELQPIACYPGELNQVFLNLLTNSIEAINKANRTGEIIVQTSTQNKHVCVKISDNGAGIPEKRIKTLFDPGLSDKQTRVKAGMGLFICQNIIRKHKGEITVASEVKKGTSVKILLPIDMDTPA